MYFLTFLWHQIFSLGQKSSDVDQSKVSVTHKPANQSQPWEAFSDLNTLPLFFYSSLPSQLVFSHSVYPNQYFFSNERPLADLNFFRKRNEPKTSNRFQLLKFISSGHILRVYMCLYQFSKVANLVELTCTYMSYSTNDVTVTSSSFVWLITCPLKKDGCSAESPSCYSHFWNCQIAQFRVFAIAIFFFVIATVCSF